MPQPDHSHPFTKIRHKKPYAAIDPSQPSLSAAGKTILITAGHTGIGYAIAENFAIAGAKNIILLARRSDALAKAAKELSSTPSHTKFHYYTASITDTPSIKAVFEDIRTKVAEPNILITSAAYIAKGFVALSIPPTELFNSFETNVAANINLVKEFLAQPANDRAEKLILDISSVAAHLYTAPISVYSITKAAFTQWLLYVQVENKDKGVRVHSFHPGRILTKAVRDFGFGEGDMDWDDVQLPGHFAVWLASPQAEFLKGRFVWANWDVEELIQRKDEFEQDEYLLQIGLVAH